MRINAMNPMRVVREVNNPVHERVSRHSKRQNDDCLPSQLTSITPACAISCLEDFVANSFGKPSCEQSSSLNYLCRTISLSGYTIGEGALQCLVQDCQLQSDEVYNICSGITGSRPKTHGTITATLTSSSTASSTASQIATITTANNAIITDTAIPPNLTSLVLTTADAPFPEATSSSTPSSDSSAGPGKTAGIALGSAAGAFGLIGLMFFFCRRRRRDIRNRKLPSPPLAEKALPLSSSRSSLRSSSSEPRVEDVIPRQAVNPSPVETITAAVEAASAGINTPLPLTTLSSSMAKDRSMRRTRSYWRESIKPEEIGVAVTPTDDNEFFRKSQGSNVAHQTRSMMPIPESAVLPMSLAPTSALGSRSVQIGERGSYALVADSKALGQSLDETSIPNHTEETRPLGYDKEFGGGDVESQLDSPPLTTSASHSILASARASLVGLGTMLKRSVSLKRQPSDAKPLLKPTVYSGKPSQPVNKYPLTPKYDNGYFEPNSGPTSTTTSPEPVRSPPEQKFKIPRKPTFSSFIAGKLLHSATFKSPPSASAQDKISSARQSQQKSELSATSDYGYQSSYGTDPSMQWTTNRALANDQALSAPKALSDVKSPGMLPAPLTIRKSQSTKTIHSQMAARTPADFEVRPPLPLNIRPVPADQNLPSLKTPPKAVEIMGLGYPTNAQHYARKPLPSQPQDNATHLGFGMELDRSNGGTSAATIRPNNSNNNQLDDGEFEPPLSAATSWLSVPVSTRPATKTFIMVKSPLSQEEQSKAFQSPESASPSRKPGFPSLAPSLNSIYTKYKYFPSQLPVISPTSAITLTAATYKPPTHNYPPVPPLPMPSTQPVHTQDRDLSQEIQQTSSPDQAVSDIQSNISTPQRYTRSINPYNPYFPPTPVRQKSTSSSRSQSRALSSHPTPAMPQLAYPLDNFVGQQSSAAYFRTPSLRPITIGQNGSRQPSSLFSPDSADPRRESAGFTPKVVVTPNKLPGGDMVLTVDTTGKGYGV